MSTPGERSALRPALEDLVLRETGAAGVVRLCPECGSNRHGRPVLLGDTGLHLSLSYAAGLAVAAWSALPVGVDVEVAGAPVPGIGERVDWTRTEASAKVGGRGLADPDRAVGCWSAALAVPDGWVATVAVDAASEGGSPAYGWGFVAGGIGGRLLA